jgi:hypothetical protein
VNKNLNREIGERVEIAPKATRDLAIISLKEKGE